MVVIAIVLALSLLLLLYIRLLGYSHGCSAFLLLYACSMEKEENQENTHFKRDSGGHHFQELVAGLSLLILLLFFLL